MIVFAILLNSLILSCNRGMCGVMVIKDGLGEPS